MGFTGSDLIPLVDHGLGNSSYLVDLGDGRALAVDASRDLRALHRAADARGLAVAFAADTHLHADFLSGAVQLHHDLGATILASAAGGRRFEHTGLRDGDEVDLGGLSLRAMATPGHTDEHLSFVLAEDGCELGVFTGGSLIVGSAARTDLLGAGRTMELTRAQYRSLQRLATLDDEVAVWPTHGAGSFCSAPPGAERITTVGTQKRDNPLLSATDEDSFALLLLASIGSYPTYFSRLGERNREGADVMSGAPVLEDLDADRVKALLAAGAAVIDVRAPAAFAERHVPAALSIPLRDQFATWLGWLVEDSVPLVIIADDGQDLSEIGWQAYKIGYERLAGRLVGGIEAWLAAGEPAHHLPFAPAHRLPDAPYLDVRQEGEYAAGHVAGSLHIELGALPAHATDVPNGVIVACGHGERAMTAASVLRQHGLTDVSVLDGGPGDYADAHGRDMRSGR
ncbi:rhodanese-like domain-containing protein [Mycobacterium sp. DBP42]|uniref:MBL fold metallo-hydrolase n=1 Tax=Mycobacterium sp. DBP42 TaxID=2545267 RepID=UPI00110D0A0C|nr:MBL fold metallo-hydrolase [Mycobacterium sp. DBP42]TMS51774.1 MBL fold metallo-hydrolase [Mycobacterium sp. DBP42]